MTFAALAVSPDTVRRLTGILFAGQSFASLAVTSAFTVSSIAATRLTGSSAWAGLPTTLFLLGGALGAYPTGWVMDRYGRRAGLVLGFLIGLLGAGLGAFAVVGIVPWVFFFANGVMGFSRGGLDLSRFAAADLVSTEQRARQVSWVVLGGAVGGIGGPLFIGPASRLAAQLGFDSLAGPFVAAALLLCAGGALVFSFLRPDPRDIGRQLASETRTAGSAELPARTFRQVLGVPAARLAVAAMIFGQVVMMTVMVMTPLQMTEHWQHSLDDVALVIAAHVTGMYATSVVTGRVADRFGHGRAILFGAALLILACLFAPFANSSVRLAIPLFILGAGWNFCYVAGSSLLTDTLRANERGRIQGTNDLLVGMVAGIGSLGSGVVFALIGYPGIALLGIVIALGLLGYAGWMTREGKFVIQNS